MGPKRAHLGNGDIVGPPKEVKPPGEQFELNPSMLKLAKGGSCDTGTRMGLGWGSS